MTLEDQKGTLVSKYRFEWTDSSSFSDDDIPLAELAKKFRRKKLREHVSPKTDSSDTDAAEAHQSRSDMTVDGSESCKLVNNIDYLTTKPTQPNNNLMDASSSQNSKLKALLKAVADAL